MSKLNNDFNLIGLLDLYQIYLQRNADKRDFKNVDNNMLLGAIALNNELLNSILTKLDTQREERIIVHTDLIKHASDTQLRDFTTMVLDKIKMRNKDFYDELEMSLYKDMYGNHFSDWLLTRALKCMKNKDGTEGGHWNLEQTTSVAKQYGIKFDTFNEYDWNYVLNMIYSDYYQSNYDTSRYIEMAKDFIMDKDAPSGKAFKYYMAMKYY